MILFQLRPGKLKAAQLMQRQRLWAKLGSLMGDSKSDKGGLCLDVQRNTNIKCFRSRLWISFTATTVNLGGRRGGVRAFGDIERDILNSETEKHDTQSLKLKL